MTNTSKYMYKICVEDSTSTYYNIEADDYKEALENYKLGYGDQTNCIEQRSEPLIVSRKSIKSKKK